MADYNVNMKQWNGSSFDNVLPLAYNAKNAEALAGSSLGDIQQWVKDNGLLLYTGQYTGTGTYGRSSPVDIQLPFEPKLFFFPMSANEDYPISSPLITGYLTTSYKPIGRASDVFQRNILNGYYLMAKFYDSSRTRLQIYATDDAASQSNASSVVYHFAAIGGYDLGGPTEFLITSNGTWTVPRTGRYYIELYGGGGGSFRSGTGEAGYAGGSSCQSQASVSLTAGSSVSVTIGTKGRGGNYMALAGGATTFGSYTVNGGGASDASSGGAGAGNLGQSGTARSIGNIAVTTNNGVYGSVYGCGAGAYENGTNGAVYLKYLGA